MEKELLQIEPPVATASGHLDGWKEIAAYLNRTVRTVQRWEKEEGLPVQRHQHQKLGSVRASKAELDAWMRCRQSEASASVSLISLAEPVTESVAMLVPTRVSPVVRRGFTRRTLAVGWLAGLLLFTAGTYWVINSSRRPATKAVPATTRNPAAYEAYLKGRYAWHKDTRAWFEQSVRFFETAVENDPHFAQGWAGLAMTYATMGLFGMRAPKECFPPAQTAAEKALGLDATLAEAHAALAQVKFFWHWDRPSAERGFLTALTLDPAQAGVQQSYAYFLAALGRHDEAIAAARRAQELEPLSATINSTAGWFYYLARRYDEALVQWRRALELEPHFYNVQSAIVATYCKQGKYELARAEEFKSLRLVGLAAEAKALNVTDPQVALRNFNRLRLQRLTRLQANSYVAPAHFVKAYAELDERERLFQWLATALAERDCIIPLLNVHPLFDPFRADSRFLALLTGTPGQS